MSDEPDGQVVDADGNPVVSDDEIVAMNRVHAKLGQEVAEAAQQALVALGFEVLPATSLVQLLKFGVDLQRKALLGIEPDDKGEADPFAELAKSLTQMGTTPSNEKDSEKGSKK